MFLRLFAQVLLDGAHLRPQYSLRTLCRALSIAKTLFRMRHALVAGLYEVHCRVPTHATHLLTSKGPCFSLHEPHFAQRDILTVTVPPVPSPSPPPPPSPPLPVVFTPPPHFMAVSTRACAPAS